MINKKRLAAQILKTSLDKVKFEPEALDDIKKALTRSDIRGLIAVGKIRKDLKNHQSLARARENAAQKRKGRRRNRGSRKGKKYAIVDRKSQWVERVRTQREFLHQLKEKKLINPQNFRMVYLKIKGGYFRNKRHIKLYLNEYKLLEKQ
jgi:large subunit ribosomal protein L19e